MKHFLKYSILAFIFLIGNLVSGYGQQFQWVKGGGTNQSSSYLSNTPEGTYYMCTDPVGNVYSLSIVGNHPIYADTFYRSGAYGVDLNLLVSSYDCSGQMRWAKLIGSSAGFSYPLGIVADSFGHIYTACASPNGTLHVGNDTSISGSINKVLNLIMLDTLGHFNWIYQVGNNTPANRAATYTATGALTIDNANNVHLIPYIGVGALLTPTITSHFGNYDMKFNSSGTLLSVKKLQMDSTIVAIGAIIDKQSNTLYTYGYRSFAFPDSSFYCFIAAFDTAGNRKWVDTFGDPSAVGGQVVTGIAPDGAGHLYVCVSGNNYLVYGNDTIGPPPGSPYTGYVSFIMKTDTSGNMAWASRCNGNSVSDFDGVILMPGNKVAAIGSFDGKLTCGSDSINNTTAGSDVFLYIADTAGNPLTLKQLHGDGYQDYARSIATDGVGNLYLGGTVADTIPSVLIPAYHSVGGNTDFFILKYGLPCNCTSSPVAAFTSSGGNTVNFTYTGTTAGLDSVVWHFGDGATGTGLSTTHAYAISDTFHVCEYTYAYCGVDSTCSGIVVIGVGVNSPDLLASSVKIYPNPATDELNISGVIAVTAYRLISITGSVLKSGIFLKDVNAISMKEYPSGIYLIELKAEDGSKTTMRVVKE